MFFDCGLKKKRLATTFKDLKSQIMIPKPQYGVIFHYVWERLFLGLLKLRLPQQIFVVV